jgi:hypothetical protein
MANGYLGKISAIVTANTADFQAKLEDAAGGVRKFSREVQSNITKAMGDAEKSIQSIYTPLQRLEGSLKAAGSLKLSFQGFAGAIKDVEDLKGRLGGLTKEQVKIVLDQSGLRSIKEVRSALRELSNRDIRIFDAAGGLRELQKLQAALNTARGQRKLAKLGIDEPELDSLIRKFQRFPKQRIDAVINVLGKEMLDASFNRAQQLFSLSQQINKPLEAAVARFGELSREVQAGFIPALGNAQNAAQNLADNIKRGCDVSQGQFEAVEDSVRGVTIAIKQLSEASSLVGSLKSGRELAFDQPGLSAALKRGVKFGGDAESQMAVSGIARGNAGDVSRILQQIAAESQKAEAILANLKSASAMGLTGWATTLQKELDQSTASINKLVDEGSKKIDLQVSTSTAKVAVDDLAEKLKSLQTLADFTITGNFQNSQQTVAAIQEVIGMMDKLNATQRNASRSQLNDLIDAATPDSATGVVDLAKFKSVYDAIKSDIEAGVKLNVETTEADKKVIDLGNRIRELASDAEFSIVGKVQNAGQAEAEVKRIIGSLGQLDAAGRTALQPKIGAALGSLSAVDVNGDPDVAAMQLAVKDLDDEFKKQRTLKVDADKAQADVQKLRDSLASIADSIGEPAAPIDRLKDAVDKAKAAIEKLPAGSIKTKLESDLLQERAALESLAQLSSPSGADIDAASSRVNAISASATAATPQKAPVDVLGEDFGTVARQYSALQSNVVSLQHSLERLPIPLQAQLIPAINKVRAEFKSLTPTSTQAEIDAVVESANQLGVSITRAQQAAKLGGTLGDALNEAAFTRVEKQLGFIRSKLLEVGAAASGPVADAFNRYSQFVEEASNSGTLGLAATTKQADELAEKIGEAAVQAGHLTKEQAKAFTKGIGDVGRMGADKFSLALNQAAFAVDDFLSSTGGLEFKLRAVSNNITQLAFILGNTKGLFIGLGAVIGGQVAVAIAKYVFSTEDAEKKAKVLNDSLAKQKSLVEGLQTAYESLAKSIGDSGASQEQMARNAREEQFSDIRKKQRESQQERVAASTPEVIKIRLERQKLQQDIEAPQGVFETDREYFNKRIGLQRRLAGMERTEGAVTSYFSRPISPDEANAALGGAGRDDSFARINAFEDETGRTVIRDLNAIAARANGAGLGVEGQRVRQDAIKAQLERLEKFRNDIEVAGSPTEKFQQIAEVDKEIGRLASILHRFTDVADADFAAAERIARELFRVGDELSAAQKTIATAFGDQGSSSAIRVELDSLSNVIAMLDAAANDAAARGEDPTGFMQDADAARKMAQELAIAANQVGRFSQALERFSQSVQQDVSTLESRAEDARREDARKGTRESGERRREAEQDVTSARQSQRNFENSRETARERREQQALFGGGPLAAEFRRLNEIEQQLSSPVNKFGENGVNGGTVEERESLRKERAGIQARIDATVEQSPEVKKARAQRDALTDQAESAAAADRGRVLGMSERDKDRETAAGIGADIAARASQMGSDREREQFINDATRNAMREAAPALVAMDEQFKNAMREPSRARIEATDINSQQGQSELNRLLRGDDEAKNQNLEVLNKQLGKLEEIKQAVIANTGQVVN